MSIAIIFLIAGAIILIGFLGNLSFERTRIPDVLVLLFIGVVLGPVFKSVDPETLVHFAEYFGSFALLVILFEGGMDIDIDKLLKELPTTFLLVISSFLLSTLAIAGFLYFVLRWESMISLLLGTILGCTSAAIVIPIVSRMTLKEGMKTLLSVESALSDVLAVVFTVSLIEFIKLGKIGIETPFRAVASSLSIAIVSGIISGFLWLKILDLFRELKYSYMITLAAALIIFAITDFLGGSGPISILIFGIVLGNSSSFIKFLKVKKPILMDETIKFFHGEITFFIRTFFFVYMGMMLSFNSMNEEFLRVIISIVLIIVIARYLSIAITGLIFHDKKEERFVIISMLPRGLASAVLATLPISANIKGSELFIDYTFGVIVLTNIFMTVGVFLNQRKTRDIGAQEG